MTDAHYTTGIELRRAVLGDAYVDRSLSAGDFSEPLQEYVTATCWGAVWGRDGLTLKTRSMLTLALLTALDRPDELELHIGGALRNGCTTEEIREVLLHTAPYCGVPATISAFRVARAVLTDEDRPAAVTDDGAAS